MSSIVIIVLFIAIYRSFKSAKLEIATNKTIIEIQNDVLTKLANKVWHGGANKVDIFVF